MSEWHKRLMVITVRSFPDGSCITRWNTGELRASYGVPPVIDDRVYVEPMAVAYLRQMAG